MDDKQKRLVSAGVSAATFLITAVAWEFSVHGGLKWLAAVVGGVSGLLVSYLYRRAVGVRLRDKRPGETG